jgi:transcriptional regulator with XRE-family HTH domain
MPKSTKPQALRRDVGTRIALLREAVALTQEQMADALAVARNTLAMWETGARTPDLNAMIRLSERFDVSLDYVYKGSLTALRADLRTQLVGLEGARRTRAAAN